LCSYFLIGFWFQQDEPPKASIKAFMTNRFGDVGFLIGIMIVYHMFGTLNFSELAAQLSNGEFENPYTWITTRSLLTLAGLLLFCGPMAKSAQVPLHVWLPDAMAGPTPVSALIHAATMVAAGVYMVGRIYFFFTPEALAFIAVIGAVTALLAASIGLVHNNIKKVLAYSTCSQLGYMMLALGVGGFGAGLFHLYTHAFFKACLFLGAGSVIHAVHTEDMREMGGLQHKMPTTYRTMMIATLALAGVPFFSGAFSKELIIEHAFEWGLHGSLAHWLPFLIAVFGAVLTFFYMLRLIHLTFWGEPRNQERFEHAHESPSVMTAPLIILAILSFFSVGWPIPFLGGHALPELLQPPTWAAAEALGLEAAWPGHAPGWLIFLVFVLSLGILAVGWTAYKKTYRHQAPGPDHYVRRFPRIHATIAGLYYFDEFYQATVVRLGFFLSRTFAWIDANIVDAAVNLTGRVGLLLSKVQGLFDVKVVDGMVNLWWHLSHSLSVRLRRIQTGNAQDYLAFAVGGMILVSIMFLFMGS
jgi:NADH-quinone oxidoreductase subunit L